MHESLTIKKERGGTEFVTSASPSIDIPQLPPPVQPKSAAPNRRGLFASTVSEGGSGGLVAKEEDVKWHQLKAEEENQVLESPPLSATVVRQLMHKSVAAIAAFYGYHQVCYHHQFIRGSVLGD